MLNARFVNDFIKFCLFSGVLGRLNKSWKKAVMKKCIHEENCSITTLCGLSNSTESK